MVNIATTAVYFYVAEMSRKSGDIRFDFFTEVEHHLHTSSGLSHTADSIRSTF